MHPELAFTDEPARGGEPCRVCGKAISPKAHRLQRKRHVCSPRCNERLKRWHTRAAAKDRETAAGAQRQPDPAAPQVHTYHPHAVWTSPGGRGYAERLWEGVRGVYALSLSTGMTKVGRSNSIASRLSEHFKNCENYGVDVVDVAVLATSRDLLPMEQSLKRFIKGHPRARTTPSLMESAFDVPFADVVDFLIRERLGVLWIPTAAAANSVLDRVFDESVLEAVIENELRELRD